MEFKAPNFLKDNKVHHETDIVAIAIYNDYFCREICRFTVGGIDQPFNETYATMIEMLVNQAIHHFIDRNAGFTIKNILIQYDGDIISQNVLP